MLRDVNFLVLGSGTSAGVPIIGCECEVCTSADPRDQRTRSSACLRFTDTSGEDRLVLIDTSPDLREQALRHRLSRCDAILFTHNHVDHTFGLDEMRRFNQLMNKPIDIYAEESTLEHLHRVYRHIFVREKNINDSFVAVLIPHLIDDQQPLDLFGIRFTPLRFLHGKQPILGFRIEAIDSQGVVSALQPDPLPLAYCTDVSGIPPQTWKKLVGLKTLVLDMLRYRSHPTHFTVDQALAAAQQVGAQQTFFTHMTHDILHADLDPRLPAGMSLAYDGLEIGAAMPSVRRQPASQS